VGNFNLLRRVTGLRLLKNTTKQNVESFRLNLHTYHTKQRVAEINHTLKNGNKFRFYL